MSSETVTPNAEIRDRPILVFGSPRSGTSLLSRTLNAHSRIAIPYESHLFNQWLPRAHLYGDLSDPEAQYRLICDIVSFGIVRDWTPVPDPDAVLGYVSGTEFGDIARAFMAWFAGLNDAARWGEKTPHHTLLHREVLRAWADAVVVIIERDPRDVALSWKRARFGGDHVLPFAHSWCRYIEASDEVRRTLPAAKVYELRYEEFVTAPQPTLERLMDFLGEDFEPAQLAFHRKGEIWKTDVRNRERLLSPISNSAIGGWKTGLSRRELRLIESVAGETMRMRGYNLSTDQEPIGSLELSVARWIETPYKRVLGLSRNASGFSYTGRELAWHLRDLGGRGIMERQK